MHKTAILKFQQRNIALRQKNDYYQQVPNQETKSKKASKWK